jgi:amino acid permease
MGYSALANEAWGRYGLLAVDFALFITLMGAGVAYFVFIETTMIHGTLFSICLVTLPPLFQVQAEVYLERAGSLRTPFPSLTVTAHVPQWCWVAMCVPLCTLLSFVNDLSAMAWVSALAIVALVAGLISVWTYGVRA